ncbi:hypothetical protein C1280_04720 [Gemmata obscuriglobus]|uniref:STAS domain-containing protein n=1 Tax=Gemmata obscuriglobus TaxID=114 RepID=A0A2Z3GV18_9BACT|nr:hypothetical protein C1280_04720 [Gemmata obscuriglobus]
MFVLSGRVEVHELRAVLSRALRTLCVDPHVPVYVNCGGVVSLTGEALLVLAWACWQCDAAGVALRLVDFPGQIMATVTDRLAETVTRRRAATPTECRPPSPRPRWDAAYSLN